MTDPLMFHLLDECLEFIGKKLRQPMLYFVTVQLLELILLCIIILIK